MKVLSLFDGISCGRVALDRAGIKVDNYTAYEIEPNAIKIAKYNYPDIDECGDVFKADFTKYKGYDLLIGGSPCTYWSIAQKAETREKENSGLGWNLFSQYIRALKESEVKYYLYENNYSMDSNIKNEICKAFGHEPIMINSATVSAQSRRRYYWTNIPNVNQPDDKGIMLSDILESGTVDRDKALCVARRYAGFAGTQSYLCRRYFGKHICQAVFEGNIQEIFEQWKKDPHFKSDTINIRPMTPVEVQRDQPVLLAAAVRSEEYLPRFL
jgi:DNA (cytosine-5)-methyltransferase 3A